MRRRVPPLNDPQSGELRCQEAPVGLNLKASAFTASVGGAVLAD